MGWTFTHRPKGITTKDWFQQNLLGDTMRFVDTASKDGVLYGAVECLDNHPEAGTVFGLVVLTKWNSRDHHNYGWKDMVEDVGPGYHDCPNRILDRLTPTESEWAQEWRQACRTRNAERTARPTVKAGYTVRFAQPLTFTNGDVLDTFVYEQGSKFRGPYGGRFHITKWRDRAYEVVA
jgi:hypothetical protein